MIRKHRRARSCRAKRGVIATVKGGIVNYRSSWEMEYALWLDGNPDVASFGHETLIIEYVSNARTGRKRRYYPDFVVCYVDGRVEVVEIKPAKRVHRARVQKKTIAAGEWARVNGVTFRVITEVELRGLGLLRKKRRE